MRIKASKRGLTFSFEAKEKFTVGSRYRYVIDKQKNEIIFVPEPTGKYIVSKKGPNKKPLIDLRNKEVKEIIKNASYIEIKYDEAKHCIYAKAYRKVNTSGKSDIELIELLDTQECDTIEISKEELKKYHNEEIVEMLKIAGFFSSKIRTDISYVFDVASLFSGAGLLDYPFFKDESFNIVFACDIDKSACMTYKENIGDHIMHMDIRDVTSDIIPDIDVAIGGPCCQGYSMANRINQDTIEGKNNRDMISEYIRLVKSKKPKIFVVENVPQFITRDDGYYLNKVLTEFSDYQITYQVVNDVEVGGYTTRKRMILIGSRIGKIHIPNVNLHTTKTAGMALKKVDSSWPNYNDVTIPKKETQRKMAMVRPGSNYKDIPEMAHLNRHSNVYRRLDENKPSVTITNWRKVCLMPPTGNRILSVSEAAALMGLNKNFKFYGSLNDKQQQVGNGVTQAIATMIKSLVKNALYGYANNFINSVLPT